MQDNPILVETRGRVSLLTLNRPQRMNALDDALMDALGAALLACDANAEIGAIVITGNDKAFAAGADIAAMADWTYMDVYQADFITNYEVGAKWSFGNGAHLNVAAYQLDWTDIQLSFLGLNGLTEVQNAGDARIRGFEADLLLRPTEGLSWSTGVAFNDAKIRNDYCLFNNPDFDCTIDVDLDGDGILGEPDEGEENALLAPEGTRLPLTARWKANSRIRYEWTIGNGMQAHLQGAVTYEGKRSRDLRLAINDIYTDMDSYMLFDASGGVERGPWSVEIYAKNLFDARAQLSKSIQCVEEVCGDPDNETAIGGKVYTTFARPRTIGLRIGRKF